MSFEDQLMLWNHASLKVLDVRRVTLHPGDCLPAYQLPSSVFLLTTRGVAQVLVDGVSYQAEKSLVCHAGKGAQLEIAEVEEALDSYMVFYQAVLTMPCRREILRLYHTSNPFRAQYAFAPSHPLPLFSRVEQMQRQWQRPDTLEKFHVKALFHHFVYDLLQQSQAQGSAMTQPQLLTHAIRYLEERYAEPITLNSLAAMLDCNARQLQRHFKARLNIGPMEYLLQVRLKQAKALLRQTNLTLAQIAEAVGYQDSYYFSRMFKKYTGVPPRHYKEQAEALEMRRQTPLPPSQSSIVPDRVQLYSDTANDENHSHYRVNAVIHRDASTLPIIKHQKGETALQKKPEKIVVLDYQYLDQLLKLGKPPVASVFPMTLSGSYPGKLKGRAQDIRVLGTKEAPDLEAIAQTAPDLIICTAFQEHLFEKLAHIAPTVMFDRNEDWRTTLQTLGSIVGKEKTARHALNAYQKRVAELKAALTEKLGGQSVALIRPRDQLIRLQTTKHRTAKILYDDLGMAPPQMAVDRSKTSSSISLEAMPALNADHLIVLQDGSNAELVEEYQQTPIWKSLPAVQADQVYMANTTLWVGYYGPIAIHQIVDEIAEALL
ncbi:AraC family transcriptional regulator [Brevibacillus migulae]|uniref:AraC family transcriptional regulator n=1 Tax=Brevibacillus migulae TaxID=1644114 RepID=UPI00106F0746|nr:AraC family transcriptional regulator [Brevibacillus migulae]